MKSEIKHPLTLAMRIPVISFIAVLAVAFVHTRAAEIDPLAVGVAGHAFDHLGAIGDQAPAAAASGSTIIYAGGIGQIGYEGLPKPDELKALNAKSSAYVAQAKAKGIRLAIAYVCATSIVKLETYDRNWTGDFRAQFSFPPADWLQQGRDGKPLPSWYGGDYRPACMNNPDWRTYEKFIVRQQLEAGHDGIFFDNPTVHPQGCYCEPCMRKFEQYLTGLDGKSEARSLAALRDLAAARPKDFLRFRGTIAADFMADMRTYARTIKPGALITCNNSLNAPDAFFAQCRGMAYNIYQMSKVEDLVVVEDMVSQPRVTADGVAIEYGPVYELLHSISHGKPLVACTIAESDYHTAPNLMRLAMAEAAAHGASYLSWPTWPENVRQKMIDAVRPQADWLRQNAEWLNGTTVQADAMLFLPFRRWVETPDCQPLKIARALSRANVQFKAVCEDDLVQSLASGAPPVLIVESAAVLIDSEKNAIEQYKACGGRVVWSDRENWLAEVASKRRPVITVDGSPTIRAVVREKGIHSIVHLLNLDVQRLSSFEDRNRPALNLHLSLRCDSRIPTKVTALSADPDATHGPIPFKADRDKDTVELTLPRVSISTILLIEFARPEANASHRDLLWFADANHHSQPVQSPADWERRRGDILKNMQEVMGPLPDRSHLPPLDLKITETFQGDGYRRHECSFANLFDERVTAYLYIPDGIPPGERRPAALALQPTGIDGKAIVDEPGPYRFNRAYGRELAQRGYVVIAPDYPSYGQQKSYDFKKSPYASGTMKAISDNLRCIDLLQSRDEVDPAKIACIGHSLGGHNALFTAAFDTRLRVAVSSCGWTPFHDYLGGKTLLNWAQDRYMPRIKTQFNASPDQVPFDFPEVLAAIAPRAIFSNSPLKDGNFSVAGVGSAAIEVRKVYKLLGAQERFVVRTPDYGHDFEDDTRRDAYRFIDRELGFHPVRELP